MNEQTSKTVNPEPDGESVATGSGGRLRSLIGIAIAVVILVFLARAIWRSWATVSTYPWHFDARWLSASAVLAWVSFFFFIWLWRFQLHVLTGQLLAFKTAFRIWVLSNLGKYVPGKVWAVAGMVYMLRKEKVASSNAVSSSILHQAYSIAASGLFAVVILGTEVFSGLTWISWIAGGFVLVIVLYPPLFAWFVNLGLRLFRRGPIEITISPLRALGIFLVYLLSWIVYGVSLWTMLKGLSPTDIGIWEGSAAFVAAYLIGFLAVFAPGGLGVREGVLTLLLSTHMDASLAGVVAVASRLWTSVVELLGLIPIGLGLGRSPR